MNTTVANQPSAQQRLLSLDFFRGLTMLLLIGEGALVYDTLVSAPFAGTWLAQLGVNFQHHPWHGLRFWDLVQPFFMFIVGVAMPFSFRRRFQRGESWLSCFGHVLKRSLLLLALGVTIYIHVADRVVFQYWNVLAQLAFTYTVAFLLMRFHWLVQIAVSLLLIALAELLYRYAGIPGFDQPFVPDRNFGTYVDFMLMGVGTFEGGHWVVFNAVSTAAHTIWGVLAGQLLMSSRSDTYKIAVLSAAGLAGLALGFSLDLVTPIIKRIATSSFVFASGGWALLGLALCYWIIDSKGWRRYTAFAVVVGMNSLFAFLFINLGGPEFFRRIIAPFTHSLFGWAGAGAQALATALAVWLAIWGLCYWMYRRKIFINI
jgi:predicted acyltransferase